MHSMWKGNPVNNLVLVVLAMVANTLVATTIDSPMKQTVEQAPSILGDWQGAISITGVTLQIAVRFSQGPDGLAATIDIPQQGANGIALTSVSYDPPGVHFELPAGLGLAVFDGEHVADSITGSFVQGGVTATFELARAVDAPAPPERDSLPYAEEELAFTNGDVTLAGTLTIPASGGGPHPAVVMITGSGPQNRDEEMFGFKPFRLIADHLTRNGIAVFRYDDRGVGGSTGSVNESTTEDFAYDALAAIAHLKTRSDIAPEAIGLLGHSEGGVVAPLAATKSPDVAFTILLAGTAVVGEEILYAQGELILRASGATEAQIEEQKRFQQRVFAAIKTGEGWEELEADFRAQLATQLDSMPAAQRQAIADVAAFIDTQVQGQLYSARTPWFEYFLSYDPAPALRQTTVPVLALFGELDLQVPAALNSEKMDQALREGGNADYTIETLPRANHLFLAATTGSPSEYATLEKEFVPELLPRIADWILDRFPPDRSRN